MKALLNLAGTVLVSVCGVVSCGVHDNVVGSLAGSRAGAGGALDTFGGQGAKGDVVARGGGSSVPDAVDSSGGNAASAGSAIGNGGNTATGRNGTGQETVQSESAGEGGRPSSSGGSNDSGGSAPDAAPAAGTGGSGMTAGTGGVSGGTSTPDCIVHVAVSGSDSNDGSSWGLALGTVQRGLGAASALLGQATCSTVEVWVASGSYAPTAGTDRSASFQLVANVALYGGFAGTESTLQARDIVANETILSGDIGVPETQTDNSYHVVRGATGATLDGFTVTGGYANDFGDLVGAGMYNVSSSPTVTNCIFTNNTAAGGAGMYNDSSSPTITNCVFVSNDVQIGEGGGMYNDNSSPTIANSTFTNNGAQSNGGGMYNLSSSPTITDSTFTHNATVTGGGMDNIYSSPTITNCAFTDNEAYIGAGMDNDQSLPSVTNSMFRGNSGYVGGGMANYDSLPIVRNSTFANNSVSGTAMFTNESEAAGGGMHNEASTPALTNCVFVGNSATYAGGGMFNTNSSPLVTSSTFTGNAAGSSGGGIYDENGSLPELTNVIFWGDTSASSVSELVDADASAFATVSHSVVQGGGVSGTSIITTDPLFVDALTGDLRLRLGSPAIDAGDGCSFGSITDHAGNSRWDIKSAPNAVDGLDIGAFEYQGTAGVDTVISAFGCP